MYKNSILLFFVVFTAELFAQSKDMIIPARPATSETGFKFGVHDELIGKWTFTSFKDLPGITTSDIPEGKALINQVIEFTKNGLKYKNKTYCPTTYKFTRWVPVKEVINPAENMVGALEYQYSDIVASCMGADGKKFTVEDFKNANGVNMWCVDKAQKVLKDCQLLAPKGASL